MKTAIAYEVYFFECIYFWRPRAAERLKKLGSLEIRKYQESI